MDELLKRWDRQILINTVEHSPQDIHPTVRAARSALRPGVAEPEMATAEQRIGQPLPPSYRAFLSRSDGAFGSRFAQPSGDPGPRYLFDADSVELTRRSSFERAAQYIVEMGGEDWPDDWGRTAADRVGYQRPEHDEAFYIKNGTEGGNAKDWSFKIGHAMHTVTIGDWGQEGLLLLNPLVVDGRGEWEVIEFHHFGMTRSASFGEWLSEAVETMERDHPDDGSPIQIPPVTEHQQRQHTPTDPTVWDTIGPMLELGDVDEAASVVANDQRVMQDPGLALMVSFQLATYDTPAVWRTLEVMATAPTYARFFPIIATGTTAAPYVTELASAARIAKPDPAVYGFNFEVYGRVALELHQLDTTSDYLSSIANAGELWALRALGRRRDTRALLPALGMLSSPNRDEALTGAEILRDLRHPDSVFALDQTVRSSTDPNLTITAAHALVMIKPAEATKPLTNHGALTPDGEHLVQLWQSQMNPDATPPA